jgi:hypothetical protein
MLGADSVLFREGMFGAALHCRAFSGGGVAKLHMPFVALEHGLNWEMFTLTTEST